MKISVKSVAFVLGFLLCVNVFGGDLFFWEVEGKVYLLGSPHVGRRDMYPLPDTIIDAFEDSDSLVLEADLDPGKPRPHMHIGVLETGKTLQDVLSYKKLWEVKEALSELGLDYEQNKVLKPWVIAMMITDTKITKIGHDPELGIEVFFYSQAGRERKEVEELEGAKSQFELMDSLSADDQITLLEEAFCSSRKLADELEKLFESWKSGDDEKLYEVFVKEGDTPEVEALTKKIIKCRNQDMLRKIERYLTEDKTRFVIIGAGNLLGDDGLIKELEDKGYKVKRFRN
ncbi:TraB/GumN family protein [bacterium]|nr:TraB/GumN family protein [bacterium]